MAHISSVVDKLITRKEEDFCQLCFTNIGPTAIKVQDEVIVDKTNPQNMKEMSEILTFILGDHVSKNNLTFICFGEVFVAPIAMLSCVIYMTFQLLQQLLYKNT